MSSLFEKRKPHPWIPILAGIAGFLLAFGAVGFLLAPRVESFGPSPDHPVAGYAPVEIHFSTSMDPACTESRFSLHPDLPGRIEWQGDTLRFLPDTRWPAGTEISVALASGACSLQGLPTLAGLTFSFQAGGSRIAYITSEEAGYRLQSVDTAGADKRILLEVQESIQDYGVSPRGDFLVYTLGSYLGPSSLWILPMDTLVPSILMDCGSNACRNPVISPDGEQVAFERRAVEEGESGAAAPAPSRVELLSIADPSPAVVSPPNHPAAHPVWAPAGWLSYFDAADRVITVEDLQGGRTHVPNATGELWIWTPDSRSLIFPEITVVEPDGHNEERPLQIYSNLYLVDMADNSRRNLSGNFLFEDSSPALSPDGRRLLFTRNFFDTRWTPGVQLWMMDLEDDSTAAVTDLPDYGHSSPRWNPDGTLFLFMRFHATSPTDPPEIWLADSAGADPVRLATGGYLPRWIP